MADDGKPFFLEGVDETIKTKFDSLLMVLSKYRRVVLAYSGGVDSAFLAYVASRTCEKCLCVMASSPTVPSGEMDEAAEFAAEHSLELRVIEHDELLDERFKGNDEKRCYYCKLGLFGKLEEMRAEEGFDAVLDGSNHDDLGDYRPGSQAGAEMKVVSPLKEAGLGKAEIRTLSRAFGLSTWEKPQMACLSSRFPRGTEITYERLMDVDEAEKLVRGLGYRDVRVRAHGDVARIEIGQGEAVDLDALRAIVPGIKERNFKYVVLDLEGYRTGSLNE